MSEKFVSSILESFDKDINTKMSVAIKNIKDVYLSDNRPWIIGYSGGKDSSTVVHLVLKALLELDKRDLTKHVYIISSDTLVETPLIKNTLDVNLSRIYDSAKKLGLPVTTHKVQPEISETFWVNVIGKGYPTPNQTFRWCTDRMKIDPANRFIKSIVNQNGEVVMLLGVRKGESSSRDRVLEDHTIEGSLLMKHSTLQKAYVFSPIKEFTIDDVWQVLLNDPSPWDADNEGLYRLYSDSSSTECPLIVDKDIKETNGSCGNSRFGCWVCTVVNEDKALSGFIKSGESWLNLLLEFRNWLTDIRDDREKRNKYRTNGSVYFLNVTFDGKHVVINQKGKRSKIEIDVATLTDSNGSKWEVFETKSEALSFIQKNNISLDSEEEIRVLVHDFEGYSILGLGSFTFQTRMEILRKLLTTQKRLLDEYNIEYDLITYDEIIEIGKIWVSQGDLELAVKKIYEETTGKEFTSDFEEVGFISGEYLDQLSELCKNNNVDISVVKKLLYLEKHNYNSGKKNSIKTKISSILNQDFTNS